MRLFRVNHIALPDVQRSHAALKELLIPVRNGVHKVVDWVLYGNFWIAACAAAQVLFTYEAVGKGNGLDMYPGIVFCGTLLVYCIHSVVGTRSLNRDSETWQRRFGIMRRYKRHIVWYGLLAISGVVYGLLHLPVMTLVLLLLPLLLSVSYVLPLTTGLSVRRLPYLKNAVVAASWSMVTTWIPLTAINEFGAAGWIAFLERFFFLFALTIPFEIRDMQHDRAARLHTIPQHLGIWGSKWLATGALACAVGLAGWLSWEGFYRSETITAYGISAVVALVLVFGSHGRRDDYYFTGLVDGVMMLMPILFLLL